jgi:hypothetical protein
MAKSELFPSLTFATKFIAGAGRADTAVVPIADGDHGSVTLICGDMFIALEQFVSDPFDIVYDRHSFGAIAPDMRPRYAHTILSVLRKSSSAARPGVLGVNDGLYFMQVAHRRDASLSSGPPFHITLDEVRKHFECGGVASGIEWTYGFLPNFSDCDEVFSMLQRTMRFSRLTNVIQGSHPLMKIMRECVIYGVLHL